MSSSIASRNLQCRRAVLVCAVTLLAAPAISHAQTSGTWTSTTGGSWGNSANWSGGVIADGTGAVADFSTLNIAGVQTVTLDSPRTSGTLLFGDTTSANGGWVLTSNTLTLAASSGVPTISVTGLGSANNYGAAAATISSVIAGSNGLNKSGTSALVLSGLNTYSGTTTVNGGYLVLNGNSALGNTSGVSVSSGGGLAIGSGVTITGKTVTLAGAGVNSEGALTAISGGTGTWAGNVTAGGSRLGYQNSNLVITGTVGGSGGIQINGYGGDGVNTQATAYAVTIGGPANYAGATQIVRGILKIGADDALPTGTTLDVHAVGSAAQSATFDLNGFNQTVAVLQSSGVLGGNANAYLQNSSATTKTFTANQASNTTFFGIIQGNLAFTKSGTGNLTLTPTWLTGSGTNWVTGTNTFSGDTLVSGGTLTLGNANALFGSTFDTASTGTLAFGSLTAAAVGGLKNSGTLSLQNGSSAAVTLSVGGTHVSSTFAGRLTGAGGITKTGSGTFTITSASSDYAGNTTVSAGTLLLSHSNSIPGVVTAGRYSVAAGATLATGTGFSDATLQSMVATGNFAANSVLGIDTSAGSRTLSTSLTGTVGLAVSGGNGLTLSASNTLGAITLTSSTLTLTNGNSLAGSGGITVNGGTVEWSPSVAANYGFNGRGIVVTGSGGTFRGTAGSGAQLSFGNLSGTGAVVFAPGTSELITSANTYSGGTTIKPGARIAYTASNGFGSGPLTIEGGSLRSSQGTPQTLSMPVTLAGDVAFYTSGTAVDNNLTFSGSMTITGAARTVNVEMSPRPGATGIFFNGPIGDGGNALGLVKTGTSMLILGGANTYTGTTTLANGTLRLDNAAAFGGGGNLSFTGGTLQYTGSNTADYASRIRGSTGAIRIDPNGQTIAYAGTIDATNSGGLLVNGSGSLVLSGSNGFTGATQLAAGVLGLANANALAGSGSVAFTGGSVRYLAGGAGADISGKIRGSSAAILIDTNGESVTFASAINNTNTAGLTKSGAGTLTLSGSNAFGGNANVNAGTLAFSTDAALALLTGTVALDGGTLAYTGASVVAQTVARPISLGAGGGTLRNPGAAVWLVSGGISGAGPLTVASGSSLIVLSTANTNSGGVTLQAGSGVVVGSESLGPAGFPTSGAFGTGTLSFAGGSLRSTIGAARTVGNAVSAMADTMFLTAGTNDDKSLTFTGPVTLAGASRTFTVNTTGIDNPAIIFNGSIGDGGNAFGLTKAGTGRMILAGTSTYTGPTAVTAGRFSVDGSIAASSGVSVSAGAVLGGSGSVAAITGAGSVAPGNSPGILTASSASLSGGLDFAFEFTQPGVPTWNTAAASGNDVLRLTALTSPLVGSATADNVFNIYFLDKGQTYLGGLFTDLNGSFADLLTAATFNYFVRSPGGAITYEGFAYSALDSAEVTRSTVQVASADFSGGSAVAGGYTMQFVVVPEPGAVVTFGIGLAIAGITQARRRRTAAATRRG